ncbi:MAG TPA: DUF72 domain-containing protein [Bdellovibrionota bacterium]|jgi:uncharacterized protein YecE (DUF72 family)|nr:DUF72 domain-containing protein [Bdellovibrionota bacterium]
MIHLGTAAWNIPKPWREIFPEADSQLERYAKKFNAVEINSSFYRDHKAETYAKWAALVPVDFRFAVKLSRYFTQETRLRKTGERLEQTLSGIQRLGEKLDVLLVQIPPSLEFHPPSAKGFFRDLRSIHHGDVAFEPRHPSWNHERALDLLLENGVTRVFADPDPCPVPDREVYHAQSLIYYRLHGSPEIYRSRYSETYLDELSEVLSEERCRGKNVWCIFDNTTFGHATENALTMLNGVKDHEINQAS